MRKTLLFDLDGTLLNTLEDLRDSTNFALRTYGYPERSLEEVRRFVGNGLKMLLTRAVPQGSSEAEIERALACMKAHYCENYHNKTVPYPGIPELLAATAAAGRVNVIATSKPQPFAERIAAHFGIDRHFRLISGSTFDGRRKTKADVIRHALSALGIAPDEAVMIGDRRHDVEGAAEEGLPAIAVEWGYAPPGELEAARPLRIVPDVETLRRLLLGNE